ncbi:uncharacterized protein BDV17DRAFT_254747 [Aspergillus undulatus]|uniref:uncharacterized protein n=1 Tax=Aspergillus undulatus TaxID=1810928 RepID=UPI003CCD92F5
MNEFTASASRLRDLPSLTGDQKTDLLDSIAKKMTTTILAISREISRGNLDPDNTAPFHKFITTIQRNERAQLRKLERKVARYQRRTRLWRAERRQIRSILADLVQRTEKVVLHRKAQTEAEAGVEVPEDR